MNVTFLSSTTYPDSESTNYGDCIIIDTGKSLVLFDCGSEEHADRAIKYMDSHGYTSAILVLSHNDSDHFNGINKLLDAGYLTDIYTILLLKYKDDLLRLINDKRITRESLTKRIEDIFDNIYSLSNTVTLHDIFTDKHICDDINIVGPDQDYALSAVAKRIDKREGDSIKNETIVNAISCQVRVDFNQKALLLCGDCNYDAIKEIIDDYSAIQLPHHGKYEHAKNIMNDKDSTTTTYYVSDNTGKTNGGSDELMTHRRGYRIFNTKDGDQVCTDVNIVAKPSRSFGL